MLLGGWEGICRRKSCPKSILIQRIANTKCPAVQKNVGVFEFGILKMT